MSDPDPDFVMRKAVAGYWVSSTVLADSGYAESDLTMRLVLSSEDEASFGVFGEVQIDFLDLDGGPVLGSGLEDNGHISVAGTVLPRQEFSNYMEILQSADPAVLEFWFHHGPEGSMEYDITSVRLTGGWKAATRGPAMGAQLLAPRPAGKRGAASVSGDSERPERLRRSLRPSEPARAHEASGGCEELISTKYGVYHLVDSAGVRRGRSPSSGLERLGPVVLSA